MTKKLNTCEPKVAKIKHTRNENGQNFTHQNKTTLYWRKKAKINLPGTPKFPDLRYAD